MSGGDTRSMFGEAQKATGVAVNPVVFRSSRQNLATAGTYIEMAPAPEPTLPTLRVLAIRRRVER